MKNWDDYRLGLVEQIKLKSKDKYTQIGALILTEDNTPVSFGYNSFPRGVRDDVEERQERPEKYHWFSHAETNAIVNAAKKGSATDGSIMYLSCGVPCPDCARNIINAGIKEVVCKDHQEVMNNPKKWEELSKRSLQMFEESGVKIRYWDNEN